jgi:hypothetical protein
MQKAIEIVKKISKQPDKNWLNELENINLHKIFYPVYLLTHDIVTLNTIVVFIVYAYDNDSGWIDLKKDRVENKKDILIGLGVNYEEEVYQTLINAESDEFQQVISDYLKAITTWKWKTIMSCFDFHAINIQKANSATKSTDELEAAKINKAKGELLKEAIRQRDVGEQLLKEIKSEYVKTDRATQQDFSFEMTDEHKINSESWRDFIRYRVLPMREK